MMAYLLFPMHGRCGSNLVAANLEPLFQQDELEIWKPHLVRRAKDRGVTADPVEDPAGYLSECCNAAGTGGAKLFPSDIAMLRSGVWGPGGDWGEGTIETCKRAVLGADGVIFIYRRNLTEQFVSLQVACHDGHWSPRKPVEACEPFAVDIDRAIDEIEKALRVWSACADAMFVDDALDKQRIVSYEDLLRPGPDLDSFNRARRLVKLPLVSSFRSPFIQKRSEQLYRKILTNYDEVNERMGPRYGVLFGAPGTRWSE